MMSNRTSQSAAFELPLPDATGELGPAQLVDLAGPLPEALLARNVRWFCVLRWLVIALLAAFGVVGWMPLFVKRLGLRPPGTWPFIAAAVLVVGNVLALAQARRDRRRTAGGSARNLWGQIVMDLIVLTAAVHFLGSTQTYVPFTYLFHIVLACIFFPRLQSLAVTLLAAILFAGCVTAEHIGVISLVAVFADGGLALSSALPARTAAIAVFSSVSIWLAVWYLTSHLSVMVRQRDATLAATNRRLLAAQRERSRHMLVTTHQLKAPFAAIHANAQALLAGYFGELPEQAEQTVERIAVRCSRLAAEIQEMLQLANLISTGQDQPEKTDLDLADILRWAMNQVQPVASDRRIDLEADLKPTRMLGSEDHLKMLLVNLVSNAVNYSYDRGTVFLKCDTGPGGEPVVAIADEGIGIAPEKLPHIFDEHYRTTEAVRHNKESSGLGLSIVRHVAELYGIRVRVDSAAGRGTRFEIRFPVTPAGQDPATGKENADGLSHDRG